MSSEKLGFALRPGVFSPSEIKEASALIEHNEKISRIFVPDHRSIYEAIEIASTILGLTNRVHAGSGVIRLLEHDPLLLARRVQTIQMFSSNRLILGVGTGSPGSQPSKTVEAMLERIDEVKKRFESFPSSVRPPEIYIATLRAGIAKRSVNRCDGLLLNFCTPQHARKLIENVKPLTRAATEFACYLKIFYSSRDDDTARRLMVQEFLNYDSTPQYHDMFLQDGTAEALSTFKKSEQWKNGPIGLPGELLRVSLANPASGELNQYIKSFREAGVTIPVLYPYFPDDEKSGFKSEAIERILDVI